jgi:hypothetical protein
LRRLNGLLKETPRALGYERHVIPGNKESQ